MKKGNEELLQKILDGEPVTDASAEADAIRQLRADLKTLATQVPECQHSKDRLREGILQAQLKPAKRSFTWGYAMMPVAAAALALLFVRHPQDLPGPTPAASKSPTVAMATPKQDPSPVEATTVPNPATEEVAITAAPIQRTVHRAERANPHSVRTKIVPPLAAKAAGVAGGVGDMAVLEAPAANAGRGMSLVNQEPSDEVPVVIVSPSTTDSGTQSAAEVSSTSDVVVGG